ncbi:hypothetical protein ACFYKX_10650 [Cytobacillus sp. FJAT-54145]|uniref:Uncharacterized protein n=1 Tax=Cytobacillus spartinae TaxID=3299023 RepID=A0ABW6KA11_9BACI
MLHDLKTKYHDAGLFDKICILWYLVNMVEAPFEAIKGNVGAFCGNALFALGLAYYLKKRYQTA